MKNEIKTSIHVVEGCVGYNTVKYVPRNTILRQYTSMVIGSAIAVAGYFIPQKMGGNHVLAVGIGATIGGVLDAFGLKR